MTRSIGLRSSLSVMVLVAALTAGAASAAPPTDTTGAPPAHWVQRTFEYTYMGFTTHYSCDGLVDNVRDLLLKLGARKKDLEIQSYGCIRLEGVEPFPGLKARFWVLVPGAADEGKGGGTVQATQWQTVDLVRQTDYRSDQGRCELLEQLKRQALPLFTSRNLNFHSSCVPYDVTLGDIGFTVDVLRPAPAASPHA
jgi:hypothetical protein